MSLLRDVRRKPHDGELIALSAADPLNLLGVITPEARVPALTGNRVLYKDGLPIAAYSGSEVRFLAQLDPKAQWEDAERILRRHVPAALADLA
ncbi:MAG: hypothetical protein WDO68_11410 [Gammaproteobacteria bacterium]